jgi:MFS family permease
MSTMGLWIHNIAAAIVVYELTRSASLVGLVSIAQFAPQLLLAPYTGARADRGDRRRQLVGGRLLAAAGSLGLAVWMAAFGLSGTAGIAAVVVAAVVVGCGYALGGPAMHALVPSMVRPSELVPAVALNNAPFTIARAAGPAVGALLATQGGAVLAFAVAGAGQLLFAVAVALLRLREQVRPPAKDSSMRAGLRHLREDKVLLRLMVGTAAVGIGADPVVTLTPAISHGLGEGSALVGALASAFGVGAVGAYLVLGPCRRLLGLDRVGPAGLLLLVAGLVGVAAAGQAAPALVAFGIAGAGLTFSLTAYTTLIQQRAPEEYRGRIMALWSVAYLGSRPLAAGVNGAVADLVSADAALLVVAAFMAAGAWLTRPSRTGGRGVRNPGGGTPDG